MFSTHKPSGPSGDYFAYGERCATEDAKEIRQLRGPAQPLIGKDEAGEDAWLFDANKFWIRLHLERGDISQEEADKQLAELEWERMESAARKARDDAAKEAAAWLDAEGVGEVEFDFLPKLKVFAGE